MAAPPKEFGVPELMSLIEETVEECERTELLEKKHHSEYPSHQPNYRGPKARLIDAFGAGFYELLQLGRGIVEGDGEKFNFNLNEETMMESIRGVAGEIRRMKLQAIKRFADIETLGDLIMLNGLLKRTSLNIDRLSVLVLLLVSVKPTLDSINETIELSSDVLNIKDSKH